MNPPADAINVARPVLAKPAPRNHEPQRSGRPSGRRGPQTRGPRRNNGGSSYSGGHNSRRRSA